MVRSSECQQIFILNSPLQDTCFQGPPVCRALLALVQAAGVTNPTQDARQDERNASQRGEPGKAGEDRALMCGLQWAGKLRRLHSPSAYMTLPISHNSPGIRLLLRGGEVELIFQPG